MSPLPAGRLIVAFALVLLLSGCAGLRKEGRAGAGGADESGEPPRRVLLVDVDADPKEKAAAIQALKTLDPAVEIEELKSGGLSERSLLYYRMEGKSDAGAILGRLRGASSMEAMPWNGPYHLVIFLRTRGSQAVKPGAEGTNNAVAVPAPPKQPPVTTEIIYYVTAEKYFKVLQNQPVPEGTVTVTLQKVADTPRCFPKITLRALTADRQLISEDTIKADSFLTGPIGHKEDLKLSFPPGERVRGLQIEVKAYNDRGEIILN